MSKLSVQYKDCPDTTISNEENEKKNVEYTRKQFNNGKSYFNSHGLHIHQSRNCPAMKNYKPRLTLSPEARISPKV